MPIPELTTQGFAVDPTIKAEPAKKTAPRRAQGKSQSTNNRSAPTNKSSGNANSGKLANRQATSKHKSSYTQ